LKLAARLWIYGAIVPSLGTGIALLLASELFRAHLELGVENALVAHATVESVSLFDTPTGEPHFHLATSPLRAGPRRVTTVAALYGTAGSRKLYYPPELVSWTDNVLPPDDVGREPRLHERRLQDGTRVRVLSMAVSTPTGEVNAYQLAASLRDADATVAEFRKAGLGVSLVIGGFLCLLQTFQASRLSRRVRALAGHIAALRAGDLAAAPPRVDDKDEIGDLARVLASATEKLRKARASQDRLVADAAHELRTPLALMRTSIDVALRRRREPAELVASLEETRRGVDRLAILATRLLDLAAAGRGEWDRMPNDLAEVVRDTAELVRAEAEEKGVIVTVDAPPDLVAIFDEHGIRQAVSNLIENAVKFSQFGGTVAVKVRAVDGMAHVTVRDEGPGIPREIRERIFEPFQRGGKSRAGSGLGLAIVREIVRGHRGRVYVADSAKGAELVLEFPIGAVPRVESAGAA
jgi:signal transduction histidine kinase